MIFFRNHYWYTLSFAAKVGTHDPVIFFVAYPPGPG